MDFSGIGKIGSFVRQKNLRFAANYKIKTGQRLVDDSGHLNFSRSTMFDAVNASQKKSVKEVDKARLSSIKQKLRSGQKLTSAEMNVLRENDTKTYKKAKYAEEVREELKDALKSAKTKNEARQAVMQAMVKVSAEASAEFAALKNGGGGEMDVGDINLGGGMVSANEAISAGFQAATGEITAVTSENLSGGTAAENPSGETAAKNSGSDISDDILDKFIMAVRAVQDEWANFADSDEYRNLPEDALDAKKFVAPDAILAYRKSMNYRSAV